MNSQPPRPPFAFPPPRATGREGLCPHCAHVRILTSAKGSTFYLCERSKHDPRFVRYPPQPRMECAGFER